MRRTDACPRAHDVSPGNMRPLYDFSGAWPTIGDSFGRGKALRERLYFLAGKNGADNARRLAALEVESAAKKVSRVHIGFA